MNHDIRRNAYPFNPGNPMVYDMCKENKQNIGKVGFGVLLLGGGLYFLYKKVRGLESRVKELEKKD